LLGTKTDSNRGNLTSHRMLQNGWLGCSCHPPTTPHVPACGPLLSTVAADAINDVMIRHCSSPRTVAMALCLTAVWLVYSVCERFGALALPTLVLIPAPKYQISTATRCPFSLRMAGAHRRLRYSTTILVWPEAPAKPSPFSKRWVCSHSVASQSIYIGFEWLACCH